MVAIKIPASLRKFAGGNEVVDVEGDNVRDALDALEGQCAEFTSWMFWDAYHDDEAENTAPGRPENWRATAWEIHPITAMNTVPCPD